MQFFEATDGARYPTSEIIKISQGFRIEADSDRKRTIHYVDLRSGDSVTVSEFWVEELLREPNQMFAAAPGTFIVSSPEEVIKWPVIGWAMTTDGTLVPVTMNGVNEGDTQSKHVLLPDGSVTGYDQTWESLEHWVRTEGRPLIAAE